MRLVDSNRPLLVSGVVIAAAALLAVALVSVVIAAHYDTVGDEAEGPLMVLLLVTPVVGVAGLIVTIRGVDMYARWLWRSFLVTGLLISVFGFGAIVAFFAIS
jgi:hypothetical protein